MIRFIHVLLFSCNITATQQPLTFSFLCILFVFSSAFAFAIVFNVGIQLHCQQGIRTHVQRR
jgi:hypothetical protein